MEDLLNRFDLIIKDVENSYDYKEYLKLKEKMLNHIEIINIIDEIKGIQKNIVKLEYNGLAFEEQEREIEKRLDRLNNIPLYVEYTNKQMLLNEKLNIMKEKIENYIDQIIK